MAPKSVAFKTKEIPAVSLAREIRKHRSLYIFLIPAVISVILFNYRPMVGVIMAFQDFDLFKGYMNSPFVGIKHFKAFLDSPDFYNSLKNTLIINTMLFLAGFPAPIIFALIINEIRWEKLKKISQTITYLPHFISWIVVASMVYKLLDKDTGAINSVMEMFGAQRIGFMREADYFTAILVVVSVWKEIGWNSIIYLAALAGIDPQLYEASMVDGAGRFKRLIYITLPGIAPTVGLLLILSIGSLISSGGHFDAIFNMQNPMTSSVSDVLEVYAYNEGIRWQRYSYAAAIGLAQSIVAFALVAGANKLSRKLSGYGAF